MKLRFIRQPSLSLASCLFLVLLMLALAACGTLDIELDQTPEPAQTDTSTESGDTQESGTAIPATPGDAPGPAAGWGPLIPYTHPTYGYELLIPESAEFIEDDLDENMTIFSDRSMADNPSYSIGVWVLPAADQSPRELLSTLSAGETDLMDVQSVESTSGAGPGAMVSYSTGDGSSCDDLRPLMAAFVEGDIGYVFHIFSHGPEQCDASDVPDALAIVESFRPPSNAPVLAMTPTPTPESIEDLAVAFTKDNNAWLWTEADGERQLTKDGGVEQVFLSDDKRIVAFRRGNGLWAVNTDGSNERQLVKESDLPLPQEGDLADSIAGADFTTGMTINQVAWIPGSHELLFNTRVLMDAPGLLLSDDLWHVDADSPFLDYLLLPGDGGNFVIAPDGNRVALVTADSISLSGVNGEDKQRIFSYTPVLTYSEFAYYAQPVWSPGSDILGVVIPPPDRLGLENQAFGVWRLHTDGTPAVLAGTIEASSARPLPDPVIDPNLEMIAYLSGHEAEPERTDLLFVAWGDTLGEPTFYTSRVDFFNDWSPGGEQFSFSRPPSEIASISVFTGQLNEEPRPVGNGESAAIDVYWIDDQRYLYLQASARGWDLLLNDGSGQITPIAAVVGQPPAFDAKG